MWNKYVEKVIENSDALCMNCLSFALYVAVWYTASVV
jgi:hypothetical protein